MHRVEHPVATIALFPSLGTSSHMWNGFRRELGIPVDLLLFDLPGHGDAPSATGFSIEELAEDATAAIARTIRTPTFLAAGVSMGGAIALEIARTAPKGMTGFVLYNSARRFGTPEVWDEIARRAVRDGTPAYDVEATLDGWFTPDFLAGDGRQTADRMMAELRDDALEGYLACCAALAAYDSRERNGDVRVPGLAVGGRGDLAVPPHEMLALADEAPGVNYAEIDGAHLAVVERPRAAVDLLVSRFLNAVR